MKGGLDIKMNLIQTILLALVALSGIPVGFLLKRVTREEMKPGRRWFRLISALSFIAIILSLIFSRENLALYLSVFTFIFFISSVPLIKQK